MNVLFMLALSPHYCMNTGTEYLKATVSENTGNKWGITWGQAWNIWLCNAMLFGVCAGTE